MVGISTIAIFTAASSGLAAQSQSLTYDRTTFVHGFASNESMWTKTRSTLKSGNLIDYLRNYEFIDLGPRGSEGHPTLEPDPRNFPQRFPAQRTTLVSYVTSRSGRHVMTGHSMGGLLSRSLYITNTTAKPQVAGIVTAAAPHQGADIAYYAPRARQYLLDTQKAVNEGVKSVNYVYAVAAMVAFLIGIISASTGVTLLTFAAVGAIAMNMSSEKITDEDIESGVLLTYVQSLGDLPPDEPKYWSWEDDPWRTDLDPDLTFDHIRQLSWNTTDAAIPRANVYSDLGTWNGTIFALANTVLGTESKTQDDIENRDRALKHFRTCRKIGRMLFMDGKANKCSRAHSMLGGLDRRWAMFTTGIVEHRVSPPQLFCKLSPECMAKGYITVEDSVGGPSDGVVPNARSKYPGLTDPLSNFKVFGLNHMNIHAYPNGASGMAKAMRKIGMREELAPLLTSVSISGPKYVYQGDYAEWTAVPVGGAQPLRYRWSVNGVMKEDGSSSVFSWPIGTGTSMKVSVRVTDAKGAYKDAVLLVYIKTPDCSPTSRTC